MTLNETEVYDALRQVIDPEMGLDVVSLGLIYDVQIEEARVWLKMTLTTRGCPMHESIVQGVRRVLMGLEKVEGADVELVWDPPWSPAMVSSEAMSRIA